MFRVGVIQNESEILRSGYANVAQTLTALPGLVDYEFVAYDGGNIGALFQQASSNHISTLDSLFISTNAASDSITRRELSSHLPDIEAFLAAGKGIYLGYQKKLSVNSEDDACDVLLPHPYATKMLNRPLEEVDSGDGRISLTQGLGQGPHAHLILNSPHKVTEQMVMDHCQENDFKRHLYRCELRPSNHDAYISVLEDASYGGTARPLLMINRSSPNGERVIISTIAVDWENHVNLLVNILTYLTEGVPRFALLRTHGEDRVFDYLISTARLMRVPYRLYGQFAPPIGELSNVHDVYVVASGWPATEVLDLWRQLGDEPSKHRLRPASSFKRLYHLGETLDGVTSLTRYANYTSIDIVMNEALLWLERQYDQGFWGGGFWNTFDVLTTFDALGIDVAPYLPEVCLDLEAHLMHGGYDSVMGPTCGTLILLNRLSEKHAKILDRCGFGFSRIGKVAEWILNNVGQQTEIGRQVAYQALVSSGSEPVIASLSTEFQVALDSLRKGMESSVFNSLKHLDRTGDMDLVRLLSLSSYGLGAKPVRQAVIGELLRRQAENGLWGSVGKTAGILVALLSNLVDDEEREQVKTGVFKGVEALRGAYGQGSWNGVIQDTAMCLHALALYNEFYESATQDLFEGIESDSRTWVRQRYVGDARVDLSDLFEREAELRAELASSKARASEAVADASSARTAYETLRGRSTWAERIAVVSTLLLLALMGNLALTQREALASVLGSAGSLLGLIVAAIIAVPVFVILARKN